MNIDDIKSLYYITHIKNLPSILEDGILSHGKVDELNVSYRNQALSLQKGSIFR